jgi:hypothetical protein
MAVQILAQRFAETMPITCDSAPGDRSFAAPIPESAVGPTGGCPLDQLELSLKVDYGY